MILKDFNSNWKFEKENECILVDLPHDAMLYEKRYFGGPCGVGGAYFSGGFYTYTKSFMVPKEFINHSIHLHVLGAYRNSIVYVNNQEIYSHKYGYTDYFVELTKYLNYGKTNEIKITVDNTLVPNSRWYSGAGLYRGVELYIGGMDHFNINDIKLNTVSLDPITLSYTIPYTSRKKLDVLMEIYDEDKCIKKNKGASGMLNIDATPWDLDNPKLYTFKFYLMDKDEIIDTYSLEYGFRTLEYTTKGFYLNGKKTILKGACLHHDNGILGAKSIYDAEVKRLFILKNAGFNAIRSAHNPASQHLLKACDRLGILVMDELVDMWLYHKTEYDYATDFKDNYIKDLKSMMDKDYNHPSVIMYSLGNELASPTTLDKEGFRILNELCDYIHKNDYRPSTMGVNFTNLEREELNAHKERYKMMEVYTNSDEIVDDYNKIVTRFGYGMAEIACAPDSERVSIDTFKVLDLAGYNYAYKRYELDSKIHPERIIVGTETMCEDIYKNYERMKKYPQVIGDFIWTGIDYLGEVGIGGYFDHDHHFQKPYPWILANGGAFDLLGYPTGEAYLAMVTYGKATLELASYIYDEDETKSAWRWTNSRNTYTYKDDVIGKDIVVEVYSIYPIVELFVNGKSLGKKEIVNGFTTYRFPYEKGSIKAIGYKDNKAVEEKILSFANESKLTARIDYSGKELTYIYFEYKDRNNIIDTTKEELIKVSLDGATLVGIGSANPRTEDNYIKNEAHTFLGACMIAVKRNAAHATIKGSDSKDTIEITI